MFLEDWIRDVERLEEAFEWKLSELLRHFPRHRYRRNHHHKEEGRILFQFSFFNLQILQPMNVTKIIGPFSGSLVFKDAEGDALDISKVTGLTLTGSDDAVGTVSLDATTGKFSGTSLKAGDLVLTATATNDVGNTITGTTTISFHADTTVTEIDINVD